MTCCEENMQGEDTAYNNISPAAVVNSELWKSLNGLNTSCQTNYYQQQEGLFLAKRPRKPPPLVPRSSQYDLSKYTNKENRLECNEIASGSQRVYDCDMGSNLSRHNDKGLNGRRAQSSGNLCETKITNVGKMVLPCARSPKERYKYCSSLPNDLDGKDSSNDDTNENNNTITDTITGNLGGTLPYKKRADAMHFSNETTNNVDLKKHLSDESLEGDPWRYRHESADFSKYRYSESNRRCRGSDVGHVPDIHPRHYEWRRNSSTLAWGRAHRSAELDIRGTLPKRNQDSTKRSAPTLGDMAGDGLTRASRISINKIDEKFKMVHKPDCELMKRRQQHHQQHMHQPYKQEKYIDLKMHKLTAGGEPQDQGYASERSPEDEHPPILPRHTFPNITPENTFRVILKKNSRGLGLSVSGGGSSGPVQVKRLFPQQPAALSNRLQPGDILLAANQISLTGLTNYEALEVLRTTSNTVELVVCRLPSELVGKSLDMPPPPPSRRENPGLTLKIPLNPLPQLDIEPCGEFDIEMVKVGGSLGFTLRKADSSALGHYVRALVREPALSDGRIQPGDKIIAVDGALLSPMSHEEAVALLRQCGPRVTLRLYRDLVQTPVSALSPTDPDCGTRPTKTSLRQEAVDMLCDLAVRKLSPGTSNGSTCLRQSSNTSCNSPRRLRRPPTRSYTTDTDEAIVDNNSASHKNQCYLHASNLSQKTSDSNQCSIRTQITNSQPDTPDNDIIDPPPLYDIYDSSNSSSIDHQHHQYQQVNRPSFLDLHASIDKPHFQFNNDSKYSILDPIIITDSNSNLDYAETDYGTTILSTDEQHPNLSSEPTSMPLLFHNDFSYKNPAYQSANPACGSNLSVESDDTKIRHLHSSEQDITSKITDVDDPLGSKGLLKWKGVMFVPNERDKVNERCNLKVIDSDIVELADSSSLHEQGHEVFMIELTRGWNSRLGFSLQAEGKNTVISVIHPDSVAAKDGRLKKGDILLMVNDESVKHMSTANIIDLLRKIRGSIGITVLRRNKEDET